VSDEYDDPAVRRSVRDRRRPGWASDPAATDEHYCCDAPFHPHWGSVPAPAATEETALDVLRDWIESMGYDDMGIEPEPFVAALRSAGYLIVKGDEQHG
jgi:hypothetical protein